MRRPAIIPLALLVAGTLAGAPGAHAAWPHDPSVNVPICTAAGNASGPTAIPDGAGGAYIGWYDSRADAGDIYVQRVNAAGAIVPGWPANGLAVCTAANQQYDVQLAPDGNGGVFVTWADQRNGSTYHVYTTRVNANATIAAGWPVNGATSGWNPTMHESKPRIAADGLGGLYVIWQLAFGLGDDDQYVTRWNGNGTVAAGFPTTVNAAGGEQLSSALSVDPVSHAVTVVFQDNNTLGGDYDLHWRGFSTGGAVLFDRVLAYGADQADPQVLADGYGGAYLAWTDYSAAPTAVDVARITAGGQIVVGPSLGLQNATSIRAFGLAGDGSHGAWLLGRYTGGFNDGFVVNHVLPTMTAAPGWTGVIGQTITTGFLTLYTAASDGMGGLLTFVTGHSSAIPEVDRLLGNGSTAIGWPGLPGGVPPTYANGFASPVIVPDGTGGAIAIWADYRNGTDYDLYAQRMDSFGMLGNAEPSIVSVRDVPNDQGGRVRVSWNASWPDADPSPLVSTYRLWRQVPAAGALEMIAAGKASLASDDGAAPSSSRAILRQTESATATIYWELAATQAAASQPGYSIAAVTLADSVTAGNPRTLFMVEALGYGGQHWDSAPDSGYSVDNLPPLAPAPFLGAYNTSFTHLSWNPNAEGDLAGYRLYRGSSAGFVPSPGNRIAEPPDTGFVASPGAFYYKLTAVDIHGNESAASLVSPGGSVSVGDGAPTALAFALWSSNPSRGRALFRLSLPRETRVACEVYDAGGRLVRMLVAGTLEAGEHGVEWDGRDAAGATAASGLYFVRTRAEGRSFVTRLVRLE